MGRASRFSRDLQRRMGEIYRNRDVDALYQLASEEANLNAKYIGQKRLVYYAAALEDSALFDALIDLGVDINLPPVGPNNPLYSRIETGDLRGAKRLLAAGADASPLRARGSQKNTGILHTLARPNHWPQREAVRNEMLEIVLDGGGWQQLALENANNRTPLQETENAYISGRAASSQELRDALDVTVALFERYATLPRLASLGENYTRATLLAPAPDAEASVLDHPETWQLWPEVIAVLSENGEAISKEDLLVGTNASGISWMERAISCCGFRAVLAGLNEEGESIGRAELLNDFRQPTPLFEALRDRRQLACLFTPENTEQWARDEFSAILEAMPEEDRALCSTNLHQLRANADRYQRAQRRHEAEMAV